MRVRCLVLVLAVLGATLPTTSAGASPVPGECNLPTPEVKYTAERFVIKLRLDLTNCSWWRETQIEMSGTLDQNLAGALGGSMMMSMTYCGDFVLVGPHSDDRPERTTKCMIRMGVPHEQIDASTYAGEFTFPWKNGEHRLGYSYDCVSLPASTASCT